MTKNVLKFKLEFKGEEKITPYAGLSIYGELYKSLGIDREVTGLFPAPGSGKGFKANSYVRSLVMMFIGGGKYIEDIRKIKVDKGLREICKMEEVPSGDAIGDWLRNRSEAKIESIERINKNLGKKILKKGEEKELTLDIDAMEVEANKREAKWTYKKNKGYMPIMGFIPEIDWCIGYEFREGNVTPCDRNYEFLEEIIEYVEEEKKEIKQVRIDAAGYQAKVINYINGKGCRYTITVDKDESVKKAIKRIPEKEWKILRDKDGIRTGREYAEFIHSMNKSDHAFRIIVQRWENPQKDLFKESEEYYYHGIATNYTEEEKSSEEVIWWHNGRSNSENYNKELKQGFNLDYVPCGEFKANAVWFGIGILAYNLFIASKLFLFPKSWIKKTVRAIRWQFIQIAGKIIKRARCLILRICSTTRETFEIYKKARKICWDLKYIL